MFKRMKVIMNGGIIHSDHALYPLVAGWEIFNNGGIIHTDHGPCPLMAGVRNYTVCSSPIYICIQICLCIIYKHIHVYMNEYIGKCSYGHS